MADAIKQVESGGNCAARGASGEGGCWQFMPQTWSRWSQEVLGYTAPMSYTTERYVVLHKLQYFMNIGYSDAQITQVWNTGRAGQCIRGVNRQGVRYDSCAYQQKVLALLR